MPELDIAIDQGVQRMISTHAHMLTGLDFGAALANDDAPSSHQLSIVTLDAQHFGVAISTIARAPHAFFMRHDYSSVLLSVASAFALRRRRVFFSSEGAGASSTASTGSTVAPGVGAATSSSSDWISFAWGASPVTRLLPLAIMSSMVRTVSYCRWPRRWR